MQYDIKIYNHAKFPNCDFTQGKMPA